MIGKHKLIDCRIGGMPLARNKKPTLPGYRYLGGTKRNYLDESTGRIVSRREYASLSGNPLTPKNEFTMVRYNDLLSSFIDQKVKEGDYSYVEVDPKTGKPKQYTRGAKKGQYKERRGAARQSQEMKQTIKDLKSKDNSPDGRKAQALVKLGRRDPDWQFPVGQSPGKVT